MAIYRKVNLITRRYAWEVEASSLEEAEEKLTALIESDSDWSESDNWNEWQETKEIKDEE